MSRIETLTLPSAADGLPLSVCVVEPEDGAPRALVQFAHGMAEHKERIVENLNTSNVALTDEEFSALEVSLNQCRVCGHRGLGGF